MSSTFLAIGLTWNVFGDEAVTGHRTEQRFPRLVVPSGFEVTLFACDPLVEYPSVISLGPARGTLFVAHDYVTGLGVEIVRRDEVRLLRDTDRDGYADLSLVVADGFNSIQGLAWHDDSIFVMHAPLLTRLRDTDGDGTADERDDLLSGIGLPPDETVDRLHCANGIVAGHDGWLYLAVGDRGCNIHRPEGDRFVFQEGGILRCRPDGSGLHVFSRGLRNIYDIALDEELNVFVRDNENDGGDYLLRVCHCFHGSDHGYPYLYRENPDLAMPPLAEFGRGSSAGGVIYLESAFPSDDHGRMIFCEWGRSVVTYERVRAGSSFASMPQVEFATGAADDPYGFRPTDVVVDYDGSLMISDWADGQRPSRGRGRIYRITYKSSETTDLAPAAPTDDSDLASLIRQLSSESYYVRAEAQRTLERGGESSVKAVRDALQDDSLTLAGQLHAVWVLAHAGGEHAAADLWRIAESNRDPSPRAQAVRAIADLSDPALIRDQLAAGRGDERVCERLAKLAAGSDARVQLEVLTALCRLRWRDAPAWIQSQNLRGDPARDHAAMMLLRNADNWRGVLELLDDEDFTGGRKSNVRTLALRALADQAISEVAAGVLRKLTAANFSGHRRDYVDLLAKIHRIPAEWKYWGFRPAPRPANSVDWAFTSEIGAALAETLEDSDTEVRAFTLKRMLRERIDVPHVALKQWVHRDSDDAAVALILKALEQQPQPASKLNDLRQTIICTGSWSEKNRLAALGALTGSSDPSLDARLNDIGNVVEDGAVLAAVLRTMGRRTDQKPATGLLRNGINSKNADVRVAALESLAAHSISTSPERVIALLDDVDVRVRRAAAVLAGTLRTTGAVEALLGAASGGDRLLRSNSLRALNQLGERRALPAAVSALQVLECQLAALDYLRENGGSEQTESVVEAARQSRSRDVLAGAIRTLTVWRREALSKSADLKSLNEAIAKIQGAAGIVLDWHVTEPMESRTAAALVDKLTADDPVRSGHADENVWSEILSDSNGILRIPIPAADEQNSVRLVTSLLWTNREEHVEFLTEASPGTTVWLNTIMLSHEESDSQQSDGEQRFSGALRPGWNRLLVQVETGSDPMHLQIRFRRRNSRTEHEQLIQTALRTKGNLRRGQAVFENTEKSFCLKCHRLGDRGGRIGPDLTGIGSRFSRIHLIESILEPNRSVAPSYSTLVVAMKDGNVLSGIRVSQSNQILVLGDNQGKLHQIDTQNVEEITDQAVSTMPEGLEKKLTEREFTDLIAFLESEKFLRGQ